MGFAHWTPHNSGGHIRCGKSARPARRGGGELNPPLLLYRVGPGAAAPADGKPGRACLVAAPAPEPIAHSTEDALFIIRRRLRRRIARFSLRRPLLDGDGPTLAGTTLGGRRSGRGRFRRRIPTGNLSTRASSAVGDAGWLCSGHEYFVTGIGGSGRSQQAVRRINGNRHDAIGHRERSRSAVSAMGMRTLHEFGPDGESRLRTFQIQFFVIVEPDPNDAD